MKNRIDIRELTCYQRATEVQKKRLPIEASFDLNILPSEAMQREMQAFILYRDEHMQLVTLNKDRQIYRRISLFLGKKRKGINSFLDQEPKKWIRQLKGWMLEQGIQITREGVSAYGKEYIGDSGTIIFLKNLLRFLKPEDERPEIEKDIWKLEKLDINVRYNEIKTFKTLNFTKIYQPDIREELKKSIYFQLKAENVSTVAREMTAMRRLSKFLKFNYPDIESCADITRKVIEEYLVYLKTENTTTKQFHSELNRLRSVLEVLGNIFHYSHLSDLILNRDIPPTRKAEFKVYSDVELKRLNAALFKLDEQVVRLMVIHQMLGTRISDTLTLCTDCLYENSDEMFIRIRQMKTRLFEKPISKELHALIEKAIGYTRKRYGDTKYIFVNDKNPQKPIQYGALQSKVIRLIYKEDIKDDNGELFGFSTHMYRHYYGVKLTEMHLDDWTIAKLLGHSSVKNVRYYRKMSNQLLADETRKIRRLLSQMILDNLDGWGEEYEQIRKDDNLE